MEKPKREKLNAQSNRDSITDLLLYIIELLEQIIKKP